MTTEPAHHLDRARAESFGAFADDYDRWRPGYPAALLDDLVALEPRDVLDAGCGTGRVAVALAARGLSVLGVDTDPRMAAVARGHGIPVEEAAFEDWDAAGRRFDLLTFAAAWHWIEPGRGVAQAAGLLRPGGWLARFWGFHELDGELLAAVEAVYREVAPDADAHARAPDGSGFVDPVVGHPAFGPVETRRYREERELSAQEWLGMLRTFSDHRHLGPTRLTSLVDALGAVIDAHGGTVAARAGGLLLLARRTG